MTAGGSTNQAVGSVIVIDSTFTDVDVAIKTAYDTSSTSSTNGSLGLLLENVSASNTPIIIQNDSGTVLAGGSTTISAWAQGHAYTLSGGGPTNTMGNIAAVSRPATLLGSGNNYYIRSKPQYESLTSADFVSVRSFGAVGNGAADDTAAIQSAITSAAAAGKVVYVDFGLYRITSTISIPPGSKIVGESFPVFLAAGAAFTNINSPQVMLRVGTEGQAGSVELSDFVVSGQGATAGAILIEYNLVSPAGTPSGMWDVHQRSGGFTGYLHYTPIYLLLTKANLPIYNPGVSCRLRSVQRSLVVPWLIQDALQLTSAFMRPQNRQVFILRTLGFGECNRDAWQGRTNGLTWHTGLRTMTSMTASTPRLQCTRAVVFSSSRPPAPSGWSAPPWSITHFTNTSSPARPISLLRSFKLRRHTSSLSPTLWCHSPR